MQRLGDIAFDHVIMWQIENIISQLLQILQSPNLVGTPENKIRIKWYHCYMPRDLLYVIYSILIYHSQRNFHGDYNHQSCW